jgi:lipopolysaccharide heptosyltransferase II
MNVALFLPNWIGDLAMATPAIRALRQQYAQARMVAVCKPYVTGLLDGSPWFDEIVHLDAKGPWSQRWLSVAWKLRCRGIDLAVLFPNSFHSAWVARLAGCKRRIGFVRYGRGWLLTDRLDPRVDAEGRIQPAPVIDDYNLLAQTAGCPAPGHRLELFTTAADDIAADAVWTKFGLRTDAEVICLNPGAAFGAAKYWESEYFARLAQDLVDRRGSQVLVLCGPGERDLARHIATLADRQAVHSIADQPLSLGLTKALLRRTTLLITTDSGPRHIASAFGRPVVTLFGPTHIAWTETYDPRSVHLQKQVPCGPCQKRICPLDHRCMKELTPAEVFDAAEELLARMNRKPLRLAS